MKRIVLVLLALVVAVPLLAQQTTIPSTATPQGTYNVTGGALQLNRATLSAQDSGTCTTANACVVLALGPTDTSANITASGTFSATAQIEATLGNGQWAALSCPTFTAGAAVSSFTSTGAWECSVPGMVALRVRVSSYTSGSALIALSSTPAKTASGGGTSSIPNPLPVIGPTDTPCYVQGGTGTLNNTTNHANCKATAAIFKGVRAINTTGTLAYVRTYNLATDATCSSATGFVESIPVPASTTGAGVIDVLSNFAYSTGLAYCVTGGSSSTDNTAPPAGVMITLSFD